MNLAYLDRPIAFQRAFVRLTGSITAALMLSQAVYWANRAGDDGWFYKTQEEWQEETGMSRREQESARALLRAKGFLEEKKAGVPCRIWYRVSGEAVQASLAESAKLDWRKAPYSDGGKRQTLNKETENTTETTTEKKQAAASQPVGSGQKVEPPLKEKSPPIPDWVDDSAWEDYVTMRKKLRKPMTRRAMELAVEKLDRLRKVGHDPGQVLEQSILNSWQGLFPIRELEESRRHGKISGDKGSKNLAVLEQLLARRKRVDSPGQNGDVSPSGGIRSDPGALRLGSGG